MVKQIKLNSEEIFEIICSDNFSIGKLWSRLFDEAEFDFEDVYETFKSNLPFLVPRDDYVDWYGYLIYSSREDRKGFARLQWDRYLLHCIGFDIIPDFSGNNWVFYQLHDICISLTDEMITHIWNRIDSMQNNRLILMASRDYYE